MTKMVVSLYDVKAEMFMQPFFVPSLGVAYRNLADEVNRPNPSPEQVLALHPQDFELYRLGAFDEESGVIIAEDKPRRVCSVADLLIEASPSAGGTE